MLELRPISIRQANDVVAAWHRHNRPTRGALFAIAAHGPDGLVGVAIVGRPVAHPLQDGTTAEVTRVATDGTRNACSFLYGAAGRAARALGYRRLVTYTLASEPGTSLVAAGWTRDAELPARPSWDGGARHRVQVDLFGEQRRPPGPKVRWTRELR